ncbi:MAG TPA: SH3 domain-containing protein [Thermoanaerobaculia bacterium]|nr:SH3 domain-containing protein [Thermoanaerobaculia bacterium]
MKKLLAVVVLAVACQREQPAATDATNTTDTTNTTVRTDTTAEAPKCVPAPQRLCPVDDANADPSFASYRQQLLEAKDDAQLRALISANARTSFGGDGGIDEVLKLRTELDEALRLGGSFREGMFWAPYVYANWPEAFDSFEHVAATKAGVSLHAKPEESSEVVARVDWEILKIATPPQGPDEPWLHVRTAGGKEGFVRRADVRSPVGYRAGFGKENGAWKLQALVSGD